MALSSSGTNILLMSYCIPVLHCVIDSSTAVGRWHDRRRIIVLDVQELQVRLDSKCLTSSASGEIMLSLDRKCILGCRWMELCAVLRRFEARSDAVKFDKIAKSCGRPTAVSGYMSRNMTGIVTFGLVNCFGLLFSRLWLKSAAQGVF